MAIQHSISFYRDLEKVPKIKDVFYQFSTLTGLCQYEELFKYIETIQDKGSVRVLDWGCGNGWFTYYLLNAGFKNVTSYGYGWDSIDQAKKEVPAINYVNGETYPLNSPSELPFSDKLFDVVFSVGVLEHVHETGGDQLVSLREVHRILNQNGTFFCYHLPNKFTWIEFIKGLFVKDKAKYLLHSKKFNKTDIETLSSKAGFKILQIERYNLLPYNILRSSSLDNKIFASLYSSIDQILSLTPLNILSQCYLFEAGK
jgi:SAM-dependent methyltransferase